MKQNNSAEHSKEGSHLARWQSFGAHRFSVCLLLFLTTAGSCFSQGLVTFQNSVVFQTADPTGGGRRVYNLGSPLDTVSGSAFTGTQWVAELYAGTGASLAPVTASISRFRNATTASKGRWQSGTIYGTSNDRISLPFDYDTAVTLMVKVWDASKFPTYEEAVDGGGLTGVSQPFDYHIPAQGEQNSPSYYMEGLRAFALAYPDGCPRHRATATAQLTDGALAGLTISDSGCGYTNAPTVLIEGGGGTGATATAVISNSHVIAINVTSAGCCYTNPPSVLIGSPWFRPTVSIGVQRVRLAQHVALGGRYVLEASSDSINWTALGPPFIAESETIVSDFDVSTIGGVFRIREVP